MPIDERVGTFWTRAARTALYLPLLVAQVIARFLLLLATALPILLPALTLVTLFQWLPGADFARLLVERYQIAQALAFLTGVGLLATILGAMGRRAWDEFRLLVGMAWEILRRPWNLGWEIRKSLVITWHDNLAQIPGYLVPVRKVGILGIGAGGKRPRGIAREAVRRARNSSRPVRASTDRSLPPPRGYVAAVEPPLASGRARAGAGCGDRRSTRADGGVRPAWDAGEPGASGCGRTPPIGRRP